MSKIRRSFSPEDRYSIVQEAIRDGYGETSRKYSLSPSLLRRWPYIEAFHSIQEHDVIERNEFASYYEAKEIFGRYFPHYKHHRLHRSIGFITPQQKWEEAQVVCDTTFSVNLSS